MVINPKLRLAARHARAQRNHCIGIIALVIGMCLHAGTASAQFLCDSTLAGADGATAAGSSSTACGHNATAVGGATAIGANAEATGTGSTALGSAAGFGSTGEGNSFIGSNSAFNAQGNDNVVLGAAAGQRIDGNGNVALGAGAGTAMVGDGNIAIGQGAGTTNFGPASNAIALGAGAHARADGAVAIGHQANATRANQFAFGTQLNTYSMAGITSDASRTAQGAPTHIVTSNATGDLAAHTTAELGLATSGDVAGVQSQVDGLSGDVVGLQSQINGLSADVAGMRTEIDRLGKRDNELADGVAIALAMAQPFFHAGQTFAVNVGWGNFDGQNAVAATAAGLVGRGSLGPGSTVTLYGGVGAGTQTGTVGSRAGLSLGW